MPVPEQILAAIRQPAFAYLADGAVEAANDRAEALAGGPLAGMTMADVIARFSVRHRDGPGVAPSDLPAARALAGEEAVDVPLTITAAGGRTMHVLATASPIRNGDRVAGTLSIWQDVTGEVEAARALAAWGDALSESERRYRELVDSANSAIIRWRADGTVTFANDYALDLFGYDADTLVGRSLALLLPAQESSGADLSGLVADIVARPEHRLTNVNENVRADGTRLWMLWTNRAILDENGAVTEVLSVGTDVSEQHRAEAALRESEARQAFLLELNDALGSLADPVAVQEAAARVLGEHLGADRVAYFEVDGGDYVIERDHTPSGPHIAGRHPVTSFGPRLLAVYRAGTTAVGHDVEADPDLSPSEKAGFAAVQVRAYIGVPLVKAGAFVAGLAVHMRTPRAWTPAEVALVRETAERTWAAVERARAEKALRESEATYRSLFDSLEAGFCVIEVLFDEAGTPVDYVFLEANPTFVQLTGLADAIGRRMRELEPAHEEHWFRVYGEIAKTGEHRRFVQAAMPLIGGWYEVYAFPSGEPGANQVAVLFTDITERKEAEEALRETRDYLDNLINYANAPIIVWNPDLRITRFNAAFEHLSGYDADEVIGRELFVLFPQDSREESLDKIQHTITEQWQSVEIPILRPDGGVRIALWNSANIYDQSGTALLATIAQGQDITERKEIEEALRINAENLQRSNEDLERFAYVSSHDLQEPLRAIVSFSQLLERRYRGQLDTDADEYIDFIVEGGTRMQALIQDLLAYSRVNTTRQEFSPTDTADVLASVKRNLDVALRESGAMITHDPMPMVMADPLQLEQVLMNLVSNAIKFRRPDEPLRVHVGARRMDGFWEFAISDNGIGIEKEYFDRIFVIFQRLHTKDAYPGTGIGLAIVKRIIDRHGGTIRVESTPGEGTTFFFTLPAA